MGSSGTDARREGAYRFAGFGESVRTFDEVVYTRGPQRKQQPNAASRARTVQHRLAQFCAKSRRGVESHENRRAAWKTVGWFKDGRSRLLWIDRIRRRHAILRSKPRT